MNLWSVSAPDLNETGEAWKCEECGHENYDMNEGECECCGMGICFMDERSNSLDRIERQIFVEEYGDDLSPIKTPTKTSPSKSTSLRELLSRHPSFQNKTKKNDGNLLLSWGSATTTPTANLSPASLSPSSRSPVGSAEKRTMPEIRVIDSDLARAKEEGMVSFGEKKDDIKESPGKARHELPTCACVSPPLLMTLVAVCILLSLWIPKHNRAPAMSDDGSDIEFVDGLWVRQGDEMFGDEPDYQYGASVALAKGGTVMAVGVGNFGPVRSWVHRRLAGWVQMGQDLSFGDGPKHVARSRRHGDTLAIASEADGSVAVFSYDKDTYLWGPLGEPLLFGVTNREDARASVSISDTGKVLAVGLPAEGSLRADSVRVLGYDGEINGWKRDIILDDEARIQHGGSVSLSSNGMVLAVGTWCGGIDRSTYSSHAEVYRFSNNTWQQLGGEDKIGSRVSHIRSDTSVSLSGEGNIVAIGSGDRCRMFEFHEAERKWSQLGQDLVGRSVSLSTDGKVLAIGNPDGDDNGIDSGEAIIYAYDEGSKSWKQIGEKIFGEVPGDSFGASLSLSDDGGRVAVGAPGSGDQAQNSGSASVFELTIE